MLDVLMLPTSSGAERIVSSGATRRFAPFAEPLIDWQEDLTPGDVDQARGHTGTFLL